MGKSKSKKLSKREQEMVEIHKHNALITVAEEIERVADAINGTGTEEQLLVIAKSLRAILAGKPPCDECGTRDESVRHVESKTHNCNLCEFCYGDSHRG